MDSVKGSNKIKKKKKRKNKRDNSEVVSDGENDCTEDHLLSEHVLDEDSESMASKHPSSFIRDSEQKKIDLSKMRMINMLMFHQADVDTLLKFSPMDNTYKILIPVSKIMLDVLTESDYDLEYANQTSILEGIARHRDVTILVQIYWDGIHEDEDKLVYAIGFVGSHYERQSAKHTLTEMMEIEEDKLKRQQGTLQRFQNRYHSKEYFESKIEKILK